MIKILVTGANGMIGSALIKEFVNKYQLVLVDAYTSRIDKYKNNVTIVQKNLVEDIDWENVLSDVFCVVHLAAEVHWVPKSKEEKEKFIKINAEMTRAFYKKCSIHGVKKFLLFSTNDVYEASDKQITEETPVNPVGVYGESKLLAEKYLINDSKNSKTSICIFRPASVYGENDRGSMKSLINLCKKGIVPMIGKGENPKALLYIKDAVQAVERYINCEKDLNGEIINISSGDFRYKDIVETICNLFSYKPMRLYISSWFCKGVVTKIRSLSKLATAAETKIVSNDKAINLLNYRPQYDLNKGLADARDYYIGDVKY